MLKKEFTTLLKTGIIKIDNVILDETLIKKYKKSGLKKGDILIASYAEQVNAGILISENRHFLKELKTTKFKIMTAEQFIKEVLRL